MLPKPTISSLKISNLLLQEWFSIVLASLQSQAQSRLRLDGKVIQGHLYQEWLEESTSELYIKHFCASFLAILQDKSQGRQGDAVAAFARAYFGGDFSASNPSGRGAITLVRPAAPTRADLTSQAMAYARASLVNFFHTFDNDHRLRNFLYSHRENMQRCNREFIDFVDREIACQASFSMTGSLEYDSQASVATRTHQQQKLQAERCALYLSIILRQQQHADLRDFDFGPLTAEIIPHERTPVYIEAGENASGKPCVFIKIQHNLQDTRNAACLNAIVAYLKRQFELAHGESLAEEGNPIVYGTVGKHLLRLENIDLALKELLKQQFNQALHIYHSEHAAGMDEVDSQASSTTQPHEASENTPPENSQHDIMSQETIVDKVESQQDSQLECQAAQSYMRQVIGHTLLGKHGRDDANETQPCEEPINKAPRVYHTRSFK